MQFLSWSGRRAYSIRQRHVRHCSRHRPRASTGEDDRPCCHRRSVAGMNPNGQSVALVTGTSSGMGLHTAVELARRGLTVVATMRDTSRATTLKEAAAQAGVEVDVRALDVTDHEAGRACVDGVLAEHGRLDVLVNNAGRG